METERLVIRRFGVGDWEGFRRLGVDWAAAPGPAFDKWGTSEEACRESVGYMAGRDNYFAVCLRGTGEVIGLLGINGMDEKGELDLGHVMLSRYQDNDVDREAVGAGVRYGFEVLGAKSIVTHNAAEHAAQLAPLRALGFRNRKAEDPGEWVISRGEWERGG